MANPCQRLAEERCETRTDLSLKGRGLGSEARPLAVGFSQRPTISRAAGRAGRTRSHSQCTEAAMDWQPCITADPQVMHGAVCFRGTRIPVSVVLDHLAAGEATTTILEQDPSLEAEHVPAAIGYAADLAHERVVPVPRERSGAARGQTRREHAAPRRACVARSRDRRRDRRLGRPCRVQRPQTSMPWRSSAACYHCAY